MAIASLFIIKSDFPKGLTINKIQLYIDSLIYLLTLALLSFFLRDSKIDIFEALILCSLWPCYVYCSSKFSFSNEQSNINTDEESNYLVDEEILDNSLEMKQKQKQSWLKMLLVPQRRHLNSQMKAALKK